MGRPRRIDTEGAWHHVMNRGAGRRIVFRTDDERRRFVELVGEIEQRFGVEVHAYCLMGNHYHLLLRSREPRLSEAMKWVGGVFTREVNALRHVDGPMFRGRFHSVLVGAEAHLDWLYRYINANPLELSWNEPLVDYPWSGMAATLGVAGPEWLRTDHARQRFGDDLAGFEAFVEASRSTPLPVRAGCTSWIDVAAAAELASAPGPDVHTDVDVRTAAIVAAIDRWDVDPGEVRRELATAWASFERQVDRCRVRVAARSDLRAFGDRIDEVLAMMSSERRPTSGTDCHQPVSDTRWLGSVAGHV